MLLDGDDDAIDFSKSFPLFGDFSFNFSLFFFFYKLGQILSLFIWFPSVSNLNVKYPPNGPLISAVLLI